MNPNLVMFADMARPGRGVAPMLGRSAPPPAGASNYPPVMYPNAGMAPLTAMDTARAELPGLSADTMASLPGGGLSETGMPLSLPADTPLNTNVYGAPDYGNYPNLPGNTAADSAAAMKPSIFSSLISKQGIGSGLGGALAGAVADDVFAKPGKKLDNGPGLKPARPMSDFIGSGYGTAVFPTADYLKGYGRRNEWNYYPNG